MYTPWQSATRYNCRCPSWNDDPDIKERALQNHANDAAAADHEYSRRAATAGPILLWICCTTCSYSWQDFDWRNASRGPSAVAELLVFHFSISCCLLIYVYRSRLCRCRRRRLSLVHITWTELTKWERSHYSSRTIRPSSLCVHTAFGFERNVAIEHYV